VAGGRGWATQDSTSQSWEAPKFAAMPDRPCTGFCSKTSILLDLLHLEV
jgi:hypothetical protein